MAVYCNALILTGTPEVAERINRANGIVWTPRMYEDVYARPYGSQLIGIRCNGVYFQDVPSDQRNENYDRIALAPCIARYDVRKFKPKGGGNEIGEQTQL